MNRNRRILVISLVVCLAIANTACPFGSSDKDKRIRTLAVATDDFAEGQKSAAKILGDARDKGILTQENINNIKPFLQQANDLNEEAIKFGKQLALNPTDATAKDNLITTINQISAALVRANNAGLLHIKDEGIRAAFSTAIVIMQAAATSAINILKD